MLNHKNLIKCLIETTHKQYTTIIDIKFIKIRRKNQHSTHKNRNHRKAKAQWKNPKKIP